MLISANFARGFEAFRLNVLGFARMMPEGEPRVTETYHTRKKAEPSGTSKLLAGQIEEARSAVMGFAAAKTPITVFREGDTVGINAVSLTRICGLARFLFQLSGQRWCSCCWLEAAAVAALTAGPSHTRQRRRG